MISFRIDDNLKDEFKEIIRKKGMKLQYVMERLVEEYVRKNK